MSILDHLNAAIDTDERIARAVVGEAIFDGTGIVDVAYTEGTRRVALPSHLATHIARHDPARALRQVAARRRTLARHQPVEQWGGGGHVERWLVAVECAHCRIDGTEPGMYDNLSTPAPWPCPEIVDLTEGYGIEVGG